MIIIALLFTQRTSLYTQKKHFLPILLVKSILFLTFFVEVIFRIYCMKEKFDKHKLSLALKTQNFILCPHIVRIMSFKNLLFSCRTNGGWSSTRTNVLKRTLKGIIINRVNKEEIIFATRILLYTVF